MPTHAIFILMFNVRCRALYLRKNCPSWTTTTTTRRSAQRSLAQKSGQPSDDERAFSHICCCCRDSWNISGVRGILSRNRNPSQPRVSWTRQFRENEIVATKIIHNSTLWCTIVVATIALTHSFSETYLALPYVLNLTSPHLTSYLTLYRTLHYLTLPYALLYLTFCHTLHLTILHLKLRLT